MSKKYDFSGWATRANVTCTDGRVILPDAFLHNDGKTVPLIWNHAHNAPENVLGHALLENCPDGVYTYASFNDTEAGKNAKLLVQHGDVVALSIYANQLKQSGLNVIHGAICEVSLVLAGANPKAFIDNICQAGAELEHSDESTGEALIYFDEPIELSHSMVTDDDTVSESADVTDNDQPEDNVEDSVSHSDDDQPDPEETIGDVFNTLNDKQKNVVYVMIAKAIEDSAVEHSGISSDDNDSTGADDNQSAETKDQPDQIAHSEEFEGGTNTMKHNVFDALNTEDKATTLSHSDQMDIIKSGIKTSGRLSEAVLQHGITNVDYLFPDASTMDGAPVFIARDQTWVTDFLKSVHHTPFSRIKSVFADLTTEDARAKGYLKGNLKQEEVFSLLKRTTTPTTIYKTQKLERDDIVDITGFDVVAWLKTEMRFMLDEEIARAGLVGDGRLASSDVKINESNIRPIWTDAELYTIRATVAIPSADAAKPEVIAKAFIKSCIRSRKSYKGSGSPTLYTTEDMLTECLLLEDTTGRMIYDSVDKLATVLRVKKIITVPVMEDLSRVVDAVTRYLLGIIVNPIDYNIGADKGGAVNMFEDFDIDFNAQKYLIETRASGALTVPYSAIAIEKTIVGA